MIAIVNYGVGNLGNLKNALDCLGQPCQLVTEPQALSQADRIILPGVGAFAAAMDRLSASGMHQAIKEQLAQGKPLLGVCVGMQLLFESSQEGTPAPQGLGLIPGHVVRFQTDLKIPQIGWNQVHWQQANPLTRDIPQGSYFYFVHSYYPQPVKAQCNLGLSDYGGEFCSVVHHDRIWGAQFHPEKSQKWGLQLLANFARI